MSRNVRGRVARLERENPDTDGPGTGPPAGFWDRLCGLPVREGVEGAVLHFAGLLSVTDGGDDVERDLARWMADAVPGELRGGQAMLSATSPE